MMAFLHLYMRYTQPLFVQAIMGLKSLYESNEVKIHVLGRASEGDLKRPFKAAGGMFGGEFARCTFHRPFSPELFTDSPLLSPPSIPATAGPATDKAAIDEAEKRIGAKKEE